MKNIVIDNLPTSTTEEELRSLFTPFGRVHSATVVRGTSQKARGLGFVGMDPIDAWRAINDLDGMNLGGKTLTINSAQSGSRARFAINDSSPSW